MCPNIVCLGFEVDPKSFLIKAPVTLWLFKMWIALANLQNAKTRSR